MNIQEMVQRALALRQHPEAVATMAIILEVAEERLRQTRLGYDETHDDAHRPGLLAVAGAVAAMNAAGQRSGAGALPREMAEELGVEQFFKWDKPMKPPRESLIIAAALIFAELEKMAREKS